MGVDQLHMHAICHKANVIVFTVYACDAMHVDVVYAV